MEDDVWRVEGVLAALSGVWAESKERNGYDGRSAGEEQSCFLENIGCRKIRGIARDLLYAEPELGAGHSHLSLSTALLTSISSCIRPRTIPDSE
jgi:hypothetical protein